MPNSHEFIVDVNQLLAKLDESGDLNTGIEVANQVVRLLGTHDTKEADLVVDEHVLQLPNAERYDRWFHNHPWMGGERAAFELTDAKDIPIQAKFYWLQKRSRQFIAGSVHFTENWEDADYTHNDNFKVGIDFFLTPNGRSVIVALSNRGNIRVVELQHKLNNTQVDIFTKWRDAIQISSTEALHTTLWESFKLQSVNKDFYTGVANSFTELLQHLKSIDRDEEDAKLFASRLLGRLLFVWFLRKKDIIDESLGYFDASSDNATNYYKRSLERLFFNTLNTPIDDRDEFKKELQKSLFPESDNEPQAKLFQVDNKTPYLNGGLFEPHDNDWYKDSSLTFPEGFFTNLYNHFDQFNFTTDESSPEYEQVAIDPEMLGRVFESLLATQVDETGQQARKAKGAFYTPREIVSYMCRESLRNYLYGAKEDDERYKKAVDELLDRSDHEWAGAGTNSRRDAVPKEYRTVIVDALDTVTVLDPACGSGAFPMGMLQLLIKTYERLEGRFDPYKTKLQIVQNNIFGADIEPMAVEISRLRAWLSLIVDEDDSRDVAPLPNLDFKFVCANSLIPLDDSKADLFNDPELHKQLAEIRQTYFNARKPHTKKAAQQKYYKLAGSNTGLFDNLRTRQLKSFDPFINSHPAEFFDADQMFGIEKGFDIVIGNPPYISALAAKKILDKDTRESYKKIYVSAKGAYDMYLLFFEQGLNLLTKFGTLSYISPTKYVSAKYAESFREFLGIHFLDKIADFSNTRVFESAGVSTLVTFLKEDKSRKFVLTEKYESSNRSVKVATHSPVESLSEFPENTWGHLLWGDYSLISKIYRNSVPLASLAAVNGSSTASEGDKYAQYVSAQKDDTSLRIVNTGNISKYFTRWGIKPYSNRRVKILEPYIDTSEIGERRLGMYRSPKIIISKLAKSLTAMLDAEGDYASTNTTFVYAPNEGVSLKTLVALLNSSTIEYIYRSVFSGLNLLGSFQYQAPQIRLLPIPKKLDDIGELHSLVDTLCKPELSDDERDRVNSQINDIVFHLYELSESDIKQITDATSR